MFKREGAFKAHNFHVGAIDNPHETRPHAYQQRFSVNVCVGIFNDILIVSYPLQKRYDGRCNLIFLE